MQWEQENMRQEERVPRPRLRGGREQGRGWVE